MRHHGFVDYDDDDYVFDNPMVRGGLSGPGLMWSLADQHAANWHPLTWVSHMLDCQLFGLNPGAHHLVSVLFHCANAVLLLLLLEFMTGRFWRCAFVAALFAWHPLRVESIAWIAERKDVLSAFFFLLTLWMYALRARNQARPADARAKSRAQIFWRLSLVFYLSGLLSKPMLVTVPLVLLLLDFWPLKRFAFFRQNTDGSSSWTTFRRLLFEKWPFFVLSAVISIITFLAQWNVLPAQPENLFSRAANMLADYLGYIEKLVWPQNLSFLYLRPDHVPLASFFLDLLVVVCVSAVVAANLRRRPAWAVGWLWFLVMLLPVTVVPLSRLSIADRYTYLPGIGFCLMATWLIADTAGRLLPRRVWRVLAVSGAAATLLLCAGLTRHQLGYWQNTRTLMEHALKIDPNNHVAKINLNIYLFEQAHPGVREGHARNP